MQKCLVRTEGTAGPSVWTRTLGVPCPRLWVWLGLDCGRPSALLVEEAWGLQPGRKTRGYSPGHLHEGEGYSCSVDGEVSVQVNDDAEIEQVDPH